jgi:hypothetical protein
MNMNNTSELYFNGYETIPRSRGFTCIKEVQVKFS